MSQELIKYTNKDYIKYEFLDYLAILEQGEMDRVYRPNDDSYFMLEILNLEAKNCIEIGSVVMEIGSGSGVLINHLVQFLNLNEKPVSCAIATDINYDANILTQKYATLHNLPVECINTSIADSLYDRLKGKVDVIICNPPYVPTEEYELENAMRYLKEKDKLLKEGRMEEMKKINCIDASYAGGEDGMVVTQDMIDASLDLLAVNGSAYLFLIFENNIQSIINEIHTDRPNFKSSILAKQRKYNELQYIVECKRIE